MNRDHSRRPAAKARTAAMREARRIASGRKFLAFAFDTASTPAPSVFA